MNHVAFLDKKDRALLSDAEYELLKKSYDFAKNAHGTQRRHSGEFYFQHPLEVARELWRRFHDVELASAALLHDVLEDCPEIKREDIYMQFGDTVGFLVDAVTKSYRDFYRHPHLSFGKVEKMLWGGMQDSRAFLLKLADRENNMTTLESLKNGKQIRMAFETQAIYEPLRALLHFDDTQLSVPQMTEKLWAQLPAECRTDPHALKNALLDRSFAHCDGALFDSLYADSGSPLWSIDDWETYERITSDEELCQHIRFVSVKGNRDTFIANFQFTGGALIKGAKFDISGYRGKRQ